MKFNTNISLEGTYSVDVYKQDGSLKYSTGPQKNFITSTGLSLISKFAIADCFRFLSMGTDNSVNTIQPAVNNGWGTKYLGAIESKYSYIGGRDRVEDTSHTNSQYLDASFTENESGVLLSRSWRVPSGNNVFFDAAYAFKEVMLSPGRGYEVGLVGAYLENGSVNLGAGDLFSSTFLDIAGQTWTVNEWVGKMIVLIDTDTNQQRLLIASNTAQRITFGSSADTSNGPYTYQIHRIFQLCHCYETALDIDGITRNGLDYSSSAYYYSGTAHVDICAQSGAFVRVVKNINVSENDYLIFNYGLNVGIETGRVDFSFDMAGRNSRGGSFDTNWGTEHELSGCHQLIHHGVKMISPGTVVTKSPWGPMTQDAADYWSADYDFGESFIGPWGNPLEPSVLSTRLSAYLTTDNLQFFANAKNGGAYSASIAGFSGTSGLMQWRQTPYATAVANGFDERHYNIRRANATDEGVGRLWPLPSAYASETDTPITFTHDVQSMLPTFATSVEYPAFADPSARSRTTSRSFQFAGPGQSFAGQQIRGIVLAYKDPIYPKSLIPYFDCLFTDSGRGTIRMLPQKDAPSAGKYTTGNIWTSPLVESSKASYWYYLDDDGKLTFTFQETWSSPCSPTVDGCPGYVP